MQRDGPRAPERHRLPEACVWRDGPRARRKPVCGGSLCVAEACASPGWTSGQVAKPRRTKPASPRADAHFAPAMRVGLRACKGRPGRTTGLLLQNSRGPRVPGGVSPTGIRTGIQGRPSTMLAYAMARGWLEAARAEWSAGGGGPRAWRGGSLVRLLACCPHAMRASPASCAPSRSKPRAPRGERRASLRTAAIAP
jgi:hypothetical protein